MDRTVALLGLLGRRLPFAVPAPKGFVALSEGGRAAVYPFLPGHNLDFAELPPGPGIAAELGRAIAALHNTDPAVYEEAGLPSYDADAYRSRRLADLDRAAETGRVPTTLLTRWETALEDVTLWRFAPTATHGDLTGDQVLAVFDDDDDAVTGKVRASPAGRTPRSPTRPTTSPRSSPTRRPRRVETVLEAYSHTRVERPDPNLLVRARLVAELGAARHDDGGAGPQGRRRRRGAHAPSCAASTSGARQRGARRLPAHLARAGRRAPPHDPPARMVVDDDDEDLPRWCRRRTRRTRCRAGCRGEATRARMPRSTRRRADADRDDEADAAERAADEAEREARRRAGHPEDGRRRG